MRSGSEVVRTLVCHPGVDHLITPEEAESIRVLSQDKQYISHEIDLAFEVRENRMAESAL